MVHLTADQKEHMIFWLKASSSARMVVQMMEQPKEQQKAPRLARVMVQLKEYPKEHQRESSKVQMMDHRGWVGLYR